MGNNLTTRMIRMFDRSHMEIQSISGQIERAQSHGAHEKHEVYMNSVQLLDERRPSTECRPKSETKQVCVVCIAENFSAKGNIKITLTSTKKKQTENVHLMKRRPIYECLLMGLFCVLGMLISVRSVNATQKYRFVSLTKTTNKRG